MAAGGAATAPREPAGPEDAEPSAPAGALNWEEGFAGFAPFRSSSVSPAKSCLHWLCPEFELRADENMYQASRNQIWARAILFITHFSGATSFVYAVLGIFLWKTIRLENRFILFMTANTWFSFSFCLGICLSTRRWPRLLRHCETAVLACGVHFVLYMGFSERPARALPRARPPM